VAPIFLNGLLILREHKVSMLRIMHGNGQITLVFGVLKDHLLVFDSIVSHAIQLLADAHRLFERGWLFLSVVHSLHFVRFIIFRASHFACLRLFR